MFFFFFKQKTAYEMRISDWSSDVCSSDLHVDDADSAPCDAIQTHPGSPDDCPCPGRRLCRGPGPYCLRPSCIPRNGDGRRPLRLRTRQFRPAGGHVPRSEEHTSELQSLMRISYAVFCLTKKIKQLIRNPYASISVNRKLSTIDEK